jgi:hypothetical protein
MTLAKVVHAQFQYHEEVGTKVHKRTGQEVPMLATKFARNGEVIDVSIADEYIEGIERGALAEVSQVEADVDAAEDEEAEEVVEEVDIDSHDDLVEWIRDDKPTAKEVVAVAGDDPERARKLMAAENEASGSQPRKAVMDPLRKIAGD